MPPKDILACIADSWTPTIGDPTVLGWATVLAYLLAGVLSLRAMGGRSGRQNFYWCGLAVVLFLLAINKELDLQSALTAAGRCMAKSQGWYADRQAVQIRFILGVVVACLSCAIAMFWIMRREIRCIWLSLIGFTVLLGFVAIRAAGFHHFDRFINLKITGIRMNWVMELGGIGMIAANAYLVRVLRDRRNR